MAALTTIAAIGGLVLAAGSGAAAAHSSRSASREAKDASRDAENEQLAIQSDAAAKDNQNQLSQANVAMRQRQRALSASYGGRTPGVATNALGNVGQAQTRQASLLGQ